MKTTHCRNIPPTLVVLAFLGCNTTEQQAPLHKQEGDRSGAIGSANPDTQNGQQLPPGTIFQRAKASFQAPEGAELAGHAKLEEITSGVRIEVSIHDAPPNAKLAVHVEAGDCSHVGGNNLSEHWNPRQAPHGLPEALDHHLGDLGNLPTDSHGNGELLILTSGGNLRKNDAMSFLSRSIVVEDAEDDGSPRGGQSKALGCAPIEPT